MYRRSKGLFQVNQKQNNMSRRASGPKLPAHQTWWRKLYARLRRFGGIASEINTCKIKDSVAFYGVTGSLLFQSFLSTVPFRKFSVTGSRTRRPKKSVDPVWFGLRQPARIPVLVRSCSRRSFLSPRRRCILQKRRAPLLSQTLPPTSSAMPTRPIKGKGKKVRFLRCYSATGRCLYPLARGDALALGLGGLVEEGSPSLKESLGGRARARARVISLMIPDFFFFCEEILVSELWMP